VCPCDDNATSDPEGFLAPLKHPGPTAKLAYEAYDGQVRIYVNRLFRAEFSIDAIWVMPPPLAAETRFRKIQRDVSSPKGAEGEK
jgi:hypothetical protein